MVKTAPTWGELLTDPLLLLAFGLGSGKSPKMPGTIGTLVGVATFPLLAAFSPLWYGLFLLIACGAGVYICGYAARRMGIHDHGGIVFDEIAGYWLAMFCLPPTWQWLLAGFVLFRFFDIVKPWPISWLDRKVSGGFGIMVDDLVAGLFSAIIMQVTATIIG